MAMTGTCAKCGCDKLSSVSVLGISRVGGFGGCLVRLAMALQPCQLSRFSRSAGNWREFVESAGIRRRGVIACCLGIGMQQDDESSHSHDITTTRAKAHEREAESTPPAESLFRFVMLLCTNYAVDLVQFPDQQLNRPVNLLFLAAIELQSRTLGRWSPTETLKLRSCPKGET